MAIDKAKMLRWADVAAHLFFLSQFILALIFYRERLYMDAAYYLYHIIDVRWFHIEHQRFVLAVSQFLPLIGIWLGLSLKAVFYLQSLNPVVFFYLLFLFCRYSLDDRMAALAIILVQCLGIVLMFCCPMYEIWYGVALTILFYAMLRHEWYRLKWRLPLFLVVELTALFSHPLVFIAMLFLLIFDFISKGRKNRQYYLIFLVMFVIMFVIKKIYLSPYESGKIGYHLNFEENHSYQDLFHLSYIGNLILFLLEKYASIIAFFVITCGYYLWHKSYRKLLAYAAFFLGHILLINITHFGYSEDSLYLERMYHVIVVIAMLPFLYDVLRNQSFSRQTAIICALMALIVFREVLIIRQALVFRHRLNQIDRVISCADKMQGSKFVFDENKSGQNFIHMEWSFSMETLIHSALRGKEMTRSIVSHEDMDFDDNAKKLREDQTLVRRWDIQEDDSLNQQYFKIQHGPYVALPESCKPE